MFAKSVTNLTTSAKGVIILMMLMVILADSGHDKDVAVEEYSCDEEEKAKHLKMCSQRCFALCCISLVLL